MKLYENIIKSTKEAKTLASHMTALGKIKAKTEDNILSSKIDNALTSLANAHARATKGKSTPTCLDKATDKHVKDLIEHCNKALSNKKSEWQVIAERNGWAKKI